MSNVVNIRPPTLEDELATFYEKHGFGDELGSRPKTVGVYTGCMLVPLPNIETRRKYLKYHDLHHLITGYSVGRIGEGEISAWELGAGSMLVSPILGLMNLIALSTGLLLEPRRMWQAYLRGCRSRNLYPRRVRAQVDAGRWLDTPALRADFVESTRMRGAKWLRGAAFAVYAGLALIVHASLAIPAVIARSVTDTIAGGSVFKAVKPVKRTDLY